MATPQNSSQGPRLSVAMIVRDEQNGLAETIESVRPIADEIVVLDTGSTDQTAPVAERLGAKVFSNAWTDDFSAARNACLDRVSGDWVLWLEVGERLTADSAPEVRRFIDQRPDPKKIYLLMTELASLDPTASNEQIAEARLFARSAGLRYEGRLREFPCLSNASDELKTDIAPGRILRYASQHDAQLKATEARRNLKLIEREAADGDKPPRLLLAEGEAHANLNDRKKAREAFRQAIESSQVGSTEMLEAYYGLLTTYDGEPGMAGQQRAICLEALEAYPLDAQLLLAMGNYMQAQNQIELATRAFQTAVKHGQVDLQTWHLSEVAEVAAVCLGTGLQLQGKDDEALQALEEALDRHETSVRVRRQIIDLHIKYARAEKALRTADLLPMDADLREPFRSVIRGACRAVRKDWLPAIGYLQSAYVAGCRDPLCLRWLAVTLLSNGQLDAAKPVLLEWHKLQPNNGEVLAYLTALVEAEKAKTTTEPETAKDDSRQLRLDPGTTALKSGPTQIPITGQSSAADQTDKADG